MLSIASNVQSKNRFDVLAGSEDEGSGPIRSGPFIAATEVEGRVVERKQQKEKGSAAAGKARLRNLNKTAGTRQKQQKPPQDGGQQQGAFGGQRTSEWGAATERFEAASFDEQPDPWASPSQSSNPVAANKSANPWALPIGMNDGWAEPPSDAWAATKPESEIAPLTDLWAAARDSAEPSDIWRPPAPEDADSAAAEVEVRRSREAEERQKTLEEYLNEQKVKVASRAIPLPAARMANEGADASLWKDTIIMATPDDVKGLFAGKTNTGKSKQRKERPAKMVLNIEQTFSRPAVGGGFRGGRAVGLGKVDRNEFVDRVGGRGAYGARGGARGSYGDRGGGQRDMRDRVPQHGELDSFPNVADDGAFPSLV